MEEEWRQMESLFAAEKKQKEELMAHMRKGEQEVRMPMSIKDMKEIITMWQRKVDEKRKLLDDAKECIKSKDSQISYLKQQIAFLADGAKSAENAKHDKELLKLQAALKNKEKELSDAKEKHLAAKESMEQEALKLKMERNELGKVAQELKAKNALLKSQHKQLQSGLDQFKGREEFSNKENQWYSQSVKLKAEVDRLRKDVVRLEVEKSNLRIENDVLAGRVSAKQEAHAVQKVREENKLLRSENCRLKEDVKAAKGVKSEHFQSKYHSDLNDKSEVQSYINELEERLQKELLITNELSNLPEVSALYMKKLNMLDPIEQIAQCIDYLVETIRVLLCVNLIDTQEILMHI